MINSFSFSGRFASSDQGGDLIQFPPLQIHLSVVKQRKSQEEEAVIEIIEAKGLLAADRGGTSDPFVVGVIGNVKFKTKVSGGINSDRKGEGSAYSQ